MWAVTALGVFWCAVTTCAVNPPGLQGYLVQPKGCEWDGWQQRMVCGAESARLFVTGDRAEPLGVLRCGLIPSETLGVAPAVWCD